MKREILFRGKTLTGEWVTGWLIKDAPNSTVYYKDYPYRIVWYREDGAHCNAPVATETVGQFTGLLDKNGTKIFEGDVILSIHTDCEYEVIFSNSMVCRKFYHPNSDLVKQIGESHLSQRDVNNLEFGIAKNIHDDASV